MRQDESSHFRMMWWCGSCTWKFRANSSSLRLMRPNRTTAVLRSLSNRVSFYVAYFALVDVGKRDWVGAK